MPHSTVTPADTQRKRELGLIHIARASVGWTKQRYVCELMERFGVDSSAALNGVQRDELLKMFKGLGFTLKRKPASSLPVRDPLVRKLRALWYALADAGAVAKPADPAACDKAIEAWAKPRLAAQTNLAPFDALRFADGAQLNAAIEQLKAWVARLGLTRFTAAK